MKLDWTINIGHLFAIFGLFCSGAILYTGAMVRANEHEFRIAALERQHTRMLEAMNAITEMKQDLAIIRFRLDRSEGAKPHNP